MLKINQLTAKTAAMEDLLFWRSHFRDSKARQLRDYRRYKKMWGDRDPVTCWMNGFATGLDNPLSAIEHLIIREEGRSGE
jgi:hypothetical protein